MKKDTIKIVIVGHVDHGKSTLIGRLLLDTKSLPKERLSEIRKISRQLGKDAELAYLTDQLEEERERNITIDTTQIFISTRKKNYVIIDTPGHLEFIKNMITGASHADCAILVVDVSEGVMPETRRHAYLVKMLGIEKVIIAFNKMDLIGYERGRFDRTESEVKEFFANLGITPVFSIPISAKEGDNVFKASKEMNWRTGPTLIQALNLLRLDEGGKKKPFRFPVQDVYEIDGQKVIVGRVSSGTIKSGGEVLCLPRRENARVVSIMVFGKHLSKAPEGKNIGLVLDGVPSIKRGDVIVHTEDNTRATNCFSGDVFWMSEAPLKTGEKITLRCSTQEVGCVAKSIEKIVNSSTLEVLKENASQIEINEVGVVIFETREPIVLDRFSVLPELGKFVLEENHTAKGAGIITGTGTSGI